MNVDVDVDVDVEQVLTAPYNRTLIKSKLGTDRLGLYS